MLSHRLLRVRRRTGAVGKGDPGRRHHRDEQGDEQPVENGHRPRVGGRSGNADPLFLPISETLVLPNRNLGFDLVDQSAAQGERVCSVRRRHGHHDSDIADRKITEPMLGEHRHHIWLCGHPIHDPPHGFPGGGMCRVGQRIDSPSGIVVANRPDEQRVPTGGWIGNGLERVNHRQRTSRQAGPTHLVPRRASWRSPFLNHRHHSRRPTASAPLRLKRTGPLPGSQRRNR